MSDTESSFTGYTKAAVGTFSVIGAILGGFLAVDSRYVLAQDFTQYQQDSQREMRRQTLEIQRQGLIIRKQLLEDRLFELDAKRDQTKLTPVESAQYNRYVRQIDEIKSALPQPSTD